VFNKSPLVTIKETEPDEGHQASESEYCEDDAIVGEALNQQDADEAAEMESVPQLSNNLS